MDPALNQGASGKAAGDGMSAGLQGLANNARLRGLPESAAEDVVAALRATSTTRAPPERIALRP